MSNYTNKTLKKIKRLEEKYKMNGHKGTPDHIDKVDMFGFCPVIISAPHSVKHIRDGYMKQHEFYTGAIAEYIAEKLGCAYITKQGVEETHRNDDPNYETANDSTYKKAIKEYIDKNRCNMFIDIHGLSGDKDSVMDICIDDGRNTHGTTLLYEIEGMVDGTFGDKAVTIDKYYKADKPNVLAKWVSSIYDIPAIELEINGKYRWFEDGCEEESIKLLDTLCDSIKFWAKHTLEY